MRVCLPSAAFCKQREMAHDGSLSDASKMPEVALKGKEKAAQKLSEHKERGDKEHFSQESLSLRPVCYGLIPARTALSFADCFGNARARAARGCRGRRFIGGNGRERRGRFDGHGAQGLAPRGSTLHRALGGCGGDSFGLLDALARHELKAQFHLLRDLVNILGLRSAFGATDNLIQFEQFRLVVFSNPNIR